MYCKFAILALLGALTFHAAAAQEFKGGDLRPHPRIFLTQAQEAKVFEDLKANPTLSPVNAELLEVCGRMLSQAPQERKMEGKRLLGVSREVLRRGFYLSWAYRYTKDEKYALRAKAEILSAAEFEDWNPSHFLDVGEMALAFAIVHDWLYELFTPEERRKLANAVLTKAFEPSKNRKYNWFLKSPHNWNPVCNAGLMLAGISFYEYHPEAAEEMIKRGLQSNKIALEVYKPDGAYPEGPSYWSYGTSFQTMIFAAMESAYGQPWRRENEEAFLRSPHFINAMTSPSGVYYNFADCPSRAQFQEIFPWFAKKTKDASILRFQKSMLGKVPKRDLFKMRLLPLAFIYGADLDYGTDFSGAESFFLFRGSNPVFAAFGKGGAYLAGKGGRASIAHGHMDAGSFIYEHGGTRWALDLGPQSYNALEQAGVKLWNSKQDSDRWGLFRYSNLSHNTLSVKGERHIADGFAEIAGELSGGGGRGAQIDMGKALGASVESAVREICLLPDGSAQIRDAVNAANNPIVMEWRLCTRAKPKILEGQNAIELEQDGKTLLIRASGAAKASPKIFLRAPKPHEYEDRDVSMVGFELPLEADAEARLEVTLSPGAAPESPRK